MIATELKLNLGSRETHVPGFLNMDLDAHPGVDYVGDVSDLSRFKDGEVAEIIASQILEHFPHPQTVSVLKEWHRVLRPGGILHLGVPDFYRAVQIYMKIGLVDWVQNQLMGDQIYRSAFHYALFDMPRLTEILKAVGFKEVSRIGDMPFGASCSNNRSTLDGEPVSLNVVAIK